MSDYRLIETTGGLEKLARRLERERVIGVDTEADSFYHYFDKLCLVQVAGRSGIFLIDPLALPEGGLAPLAPVLESPEIRVIFHAADYDLYVLQRYGNLRVRGLFDTMLSAQLLGYRAVGLGALVERHFGIKLSKDQQRTDWSRRPLREAQREYAASDVRYLVELASTLEKELRAKKRLSWARNEFQLLEERVLPERGFDRNGHLRIKGARKLSPRGLAILRELYLARDRRARELDRPPFKVLGNGTLLELAQNPPASRKALVRRKGITDLVLRRHGQEILDAVARGMAAPEQAPPAAGRTDGARTNGSRRHLDRAAEARLEHLKRWRSTRAREFDMDPGVLCPNAALEQIAWANCETLEDLEQLEALRGWRMEALGEQIFEALGRARRTAAGAGSPSRGHKRSEGRRGSPRG